MKILIDLTSLTDNFSGIELYAMSVAKELIKNKNNDFILVFKNVIHNAFLEEYSNVKKLIINGKNKLVFNQFILPMKLYRIKADRYLFMAFTEPFFWFKKGTINAIHDVSCWDCPGSNKKHMILYWKIMFKKVALRKGRVITVSEFSKKRIQQILHISPELITVTYSAPLQETTNKIFNPDHYFEVAKKYNLPSEYLLCLSTLEPRKNIRFFLEAYNDMVMKNEIDLDVVIAGRKGWMVDNLMFELNEITKKRLHFTGFINNEDLPFIYHGANVFVFPSIYEGFGVPPLEALCQRTMVIASNVASMPEVLGTSAIFFDVTNIQDLEEKIKFVIKMKDDEKDKYFFNIDKLMKIYNWQEVSRKILNVCQQ